MKINHKAGIRETFAQLPALKEVYVLESGAHYFTKAHAEAAIGQDEKGKLKGPLHTLKPDAKELQDEQKPAA